MNHDDYYMDLATAVRSGADCTGTNVGAVIALEDRVVSTGYNGTPAGFSNCNDGGCLRCLDSKAHREERYQEMAVQSHRPGEANGATLTRKAESSLPRASPRRSPVESIREYSASCR
jgi:deoxycytidylate deaminase